MPMCDKCYIIAIEHGADFELPEFHTDIIDRIEKEKLLPKINFPKTHISINQLLNDESFRILLDAMPEKFIRYRNEKEKK
jgi:hypothetical protein